MDVSAGGHIPAPRVECTSKPAFLQEEAVVLVVDQHGHRAMIKELAVHLGQGQHEQRAVAVVHGLHQRWLGRGAMVQDGHGAQCMTELGRFPAHAGGTPETGAEVLGPADIRAVMELEALCFAYHWTEEQFRLGLERGAFHILGVRRSGKIVGYIAYSVIQDEMEVMNLAVHPEFRRQGLGATLLDAALGHSRRAGARQGFLDVKESNLPAIDLYRKFGFKQIGVRKRYYPDTLEDALLFRCDIP